jgi:hypothetical protein
VLLAVFGSNFNIAHIFLDLSLATALTFFERSATFLGFAVVTAALELQTGDTLSLLLVFPFFVNV